MRKLPVLLAALVVVAVLVPAQAQAFKPQITYVRATADEGGIRFSAKINMDKTSRNKRKAKVTYKGVTKEAVRLSHPPLSFHETGVFNAPIRDCYRVTVTATNKYGTTVETVKASRLSTDGCD